MLVGGIHFLCASDGPNIDCLVPSWIEKKEEQMHVLACYLLLIIFLLLAMVKYYFFFVGYVEMFL